ncbi:hypothetical protein ACWC5I_02540 [Kitasatospora sp. NPDC001574]
MNTTDQNSITGRSTVPAPAGPPNEHLETLAGNPWAALALEISHTGGFRLWDVERLVRTAGAQRAGSRVIEGIEQHLADNRLGHFPSRLPTDSTCKVLLYGKSDLNIGYVLSLVHTLATEDVNEDTNAQLHRLDLLLQSITAVMKASRTGGSRGPQE